MGTMFKWNSVPPGSGSGGGAEQGGSVQKGKMQ